MKIKLQISAIALLVLFVKLSCPAFSQQIVFNKVSPPDGKTFVQVTGICQDLDGNMWFATKNGLYRYDGYLMLSYKHNPLDENSLANDTLESIAIDFTGKIWIGTWNGLDCFDPATGVFKHYRHDAADSKSLGGDWIGKLLIDHEGILWVATDGLDRYDRQTDSFIHYSNIPGDTTSLSCNEVHALYEDKQGVIWVGTGEIWNGGKDSFERGGLNRLDKNTGTFTRYMHDQNNTNSLINNKVSAILEDSKGTFWVGTAGDGLHTMDREKGTFVRHTYDPKHPEKLSRPPLNNLSEEFKRIEFITFIHEDAIGGIYIATLHAGLNYYDPKTEKTTYLESSVYFNGDYDGGTPWCAYTSHEGVVWVSSLTGYLYRTDPFQKQIPHYKTSNDPVRSFYEESKGTLLIGTENALIQNDKTKGIVKRNVIDVNPARDNNGVITIKQDRQDKIWLGTREGLAQWIKSTESFIPYLNVKGPIWSIYEDRDSNLWIGNDNGLSLFNRKTGLSTQYLIYPKEDTINAAKNSISSILQDKTGKLWVGTWYHGGINLFNRETGKFRTYLDGKGISTICEDADGILWTGGSNGLHKYDTATDEFIQFTGPTNSSEITTITSMVEDNQKYLWIGTWDKKIIRLNPQRNAIVIYDKKNVVENSLLWNSVYKGRNGDLYFGDDSGYFSFNPEDFTENIKPPQIVFNSFFLGNQAVKPDPAGPLKESLSQAKEIRLNYNQNVFSFEFVAINYSNPDENQHFYMLENYDNDWRKSNSERRAYYFNVPPGKYVFRVKAMSSTGAWAEKKIDISVLPPWWATWWFRVLSVIALVIVIYAIIKERSLKLKAENILLEKKVNERTQQLQLSIHELKSTQSQLIQSEKMASLGELTAGIAHEIQNPLNFVNNFSEINTELISELELERKKEIRDFENEDDILKDIKENEQKINHHGKRADAIVKGMLQHSRSSTGVKEPTDMNKLADEYLRLAYHGLRAKDKSFNATMKTDFDESIGKIDIIPQDIGRVILNLITNAFYAVNIRKIATVETRHALSLQQPTIPISQSDYEPTVWVGTKRTFNTVEVFVKDNGNGIPKSALDKIFQPFFTTKPTGQGTGLGLSLAYDIVKAHGGELKVETKEGEGTEFMIMLPVV